LVAALAGATDEHTEDILRRYRETTADMKGERQ
jgi:hypothetical protein